IKEMIQKPEVTEDKKEEMLIRIWIEEKAKELITMVSKLYPYEGSPCIISKSKAKDFICKIVGEIHGRKKD
ncbi:MAG: hypothetical protein KAV87_06330, partial [Desulfobacteraceae bacterium]|nr:hypothetical protein [Desulfobacteraceae bacterium]